MVTTAFVILNSADANLRDDAIISIQNVQDLLTEQLDLGFRIPGSAESLSFKDWVINKVNNRLGWKIETQNFTFDGVSLRNFLITGAELPEGDYPTYVIGAHYDTRISADKSDATMPVPGANDGASGIAAILEIMNHIPQNFRQFVGFAMFDAEDQGSLSSGQFAGWPWIVGASEFVSRLSNSQVESIEAFVLLDMVGDPDLNIKYEGRSYSTNPELVEEVWGMADTLGYGDIFIDQIGYSLLDDHRPFIDRGISAIDIIDFDFTEHHTTLDDLDHVSAESVAVVSDVVLNWINTRIENDLNLTSTFSQMDSSSEIDTSETSSILTDQTDTSSSGSLGRSTTTEIITTFLTTFSNPTSIIQTGVSSGSTGQSDVSLNFVFILISVLIYCGIAQKRKGKRRPSHRL